MKKLLPFIVLLAMMACTVNYYDYSSHSSGGEPQKPDTVFVEPEPPQSGQLPPSQPDTVFSTRNLVGGGVVEITQCGGWKRHVLTGCVSETDGAALEIRPVVVYQTDGTGAITKTHELIFNCRLQSWLVDGASGDGFTRTSGENVLPVVSGDRILTLVAGNTTYPFLAERCSDYDSDWLPDGTLRYTAVFQVSDWMARDILTSDALAVVSGSPDFRLVFSDDSRRLFQQFHDIFIVHDGDAPILPVRGRNEGSVD